MIDRGPAVAPEKRRPVVTAGLLLGAITLLAVIPACSSSSSTASVGTTSSTTPTTSAVTVPEQNPAEIAACVADAQSVQMALAAYMALKGDYPTPPASWGPASYAANFAPLTAASDGGPFLQVPPGTRFYVIAYDASGHVWVAPPGSFGPYDSGQDFALHPTICDAAVL